MKQNPNTFFMRTYGCQMNELDTELMVGALKKRGLLQVEKETDADLLIFNTCSIRDLAERKVMGKLGQIGKWRSKRPIIGVTGCMAMAKKDRLFKKVPHVDFVLGTNNITDLDDVLDAVITTGKKTCLTDTRFEENLDYSVAERDDKIKAYVSIIRGCDKFCTYCVVPYTRNQEVSRPSDSIVEEVKRLVDSGYKEITLLGQNVNSYGKDFKEKKELFHDLLYRIDKETDINRVRFMTSHPVDITKNLMHAVADLPSLCELVHFPLQAGSSRVLQRMHRIYTKEEYMDKVALFREILPSVRLGTDIIVGFPGETEKEFEETMQAFRDIRYSLAFIFAYSERKGTPAMRFKDDIPESVKSERLQKLLALHTEIANEEFTSFIGEKQEILVESVTSNGKLKGRTRCWKKTVFDGDSSLVGSLVTVEIHSFSNQTLFGIKE